MSLTYRILAILSLSLLAACATGGLGASDGTTAPGVARGGENIDGLIVGHRLMAAGEYELALESYHRAAAEQGINADVLSAIGSANLQLGRLNQAEQVLRRATEADETFPPAWNNLGVVLMETGRYGEASRVFRIAFALDNGRSVEIRDNLRKALAKMDNTPYSEDESEFRLVRRGPGSYQILDDTEIP